MNLNWLGIASVALAVVAFWCVYRIAMGKPLKQRVVLSVVAAVLALPGLSFAGYYSHLLPESAWYYGMRSMVGTEFLLVLVGMAGGAVATLLPRGGMVLPLSGVVILVLVPFCKPVIRPLPAGTFKEKWQDGVCLQSTPSTCGAASLATILHHYGVEVTEAELAHEAYSYAGGTEVWYLARAARARGCVVDFDVAPGIRLDGGLPAIVGVRFGATGHFIALISREGERFVVGEPLSGQKLLTLDEMKMRYTFTGFQMRVRCGDASLRGRPVVGACW